MIDLANDKLMTLGQAARQLGRAIETLHNWRKRGQLEAVLLGGWWYTTAGALEQMTRRSTESAERVEAVSRRRRRPASKQHQEALRYLRQLGVA